MSKVGVVVFPGSNCDQDVLHVYRELLAVDAVPLWHADRALKNCDVVVLPGGFSYGDYLRTGALAKRAPVMEEVVKFAAAGGPVLGICNGFQILCEAGLLPGALVRNAGLRFVSKEVPVVVERTDTPFTRLYREGDTFRWPVAHAEGNYYADRDVLDRLEGEGRVVFRYGGPGAAPNGSARDIAGVCDARRNVVGLMPHPERACESLVGGGESGQALFRSVLDLVA